MIKVVRFQNGDMVCGDYTLNADTGLVTLKNPLFIMLSQAGARFIDLLSAFSQDKELSFKESDVLMVINPSESATKTYEEIIADSPVVVPKKKSLIV